MLAVPRPTIREECRCEARPCPWVGCRHHLLLDVKALSPHGKGRRPKLVLYGPTANNAEGRPPGLSSSAAAVEVETWTDEAVERLSRMRHTCSLDVSEAGGINYLTMGRLLGVTRQAVAATQARALVRLKIGLMRALDVDAHELAQLLADVGGGGALDA